MSTKFSDDPEELDEIDKEIERLNLSRERYKKKAEARSIKKEIFDLQHPQYTEGKKAVGRASNKLATFSSGIIKQGARALQSRRTRRGVRRTTYQRKPVSVRANEDISLVKAIATNDWSGSGNGLMGRDFFGNHEERELLPDTNKNFNLASNDEMKKRRLI